MSLDVGIPEIRQNARLLDYVIYVCIYTRVGISFVDMKEYLFYNIKRTYFGRRLRIMFVTYIF